MEAYRDQYAKLFDNGRNVVVLAVSVDADTMLASWARDLQTPVLLGSDPDQKVGLLYGAVRGKLDNRSLFVIDPTGHVVHRMQPFNELAQRSYDELEAVVRKTSGAAPSTPSR